MFAELHRRLGGPEPAEVHRLEHEWERQAAMALRRRDPAAVTAYDGHNRVCSGSRDQVLDAAHRFWAEGHQRGHNTLLVARSNEAVDELNRRARHTLVERGLVDAGGAAIAGDAVANVGDIVVTRRPERTIPVSVASPLATTVPSTHPRVGNGSSRSQKPRWRISRWISLARSRVQSFDSPARMSRRRMRSYGCPRRW